MSTPTTTASSHAGLGPALLGLDRALDAPRDGLRAHGGWRWGVRQRMAAVRDALLDEVERSEDGWLAARSGGIIRDRNALLGRLTLLGSEVLETGDLERVRMELKRLVTDISHYVQRVHDLAYDAVELELGGSE